MLMVEMYEHVDLSEKQVPAAVNAVNTESNAQLQQEKVADQQESSRQEQTGSSQQV